MTMHRLVALSAAAGLTLGAVVAVPTMAGADDQAFPNPPKAGEAVSAMKCFGGDEDTQDSFNQFGPDEGWPSEDGDYYAPMDVRVTSTVPSGLIPGTTEDTSFALQFQLEDEDLVHTMGLGDPPTLENVVAGIEVSGGGSGGPYAFSPTSGPITMFEPLFPVLTAAGPVTISSYELIFYSLTSPITMDIVAPPPAQMSHSLACTVDEPLVAMTASIWSCGCDTAPPTTTRPDDGPREADPFYAG